MLDNTRPRGLLPRSAPAFLLPQDRSRHGCFLPAPDKSDKSSERVNSYLDLIDLIFQPDLRRRKARYPCWAKKNIVKMQRKKSNMPEAAKIQDGIWGILIKATINEKTIKAIVPHVITLLPGSRFQFSFEPRAPHKTGR